MKKNKQALRNQNQELVDLVGSQERFIRGVEKEIYENVSQVLCLARIKLTGIDWTDKNQSEQIIGQSDDLILKAIHDLRNLVKQAKRI